MWAYFTTYPAFIDLWQDFSCDFSVGTASVPVIRSGPNDTDFLIYEFEVQKLREEIEKLTKELELTKKVCVP